MKGKTSIFGDPESLKAQVAAKLRLLDGGKAEGAGQPVPSRKGSPQKRLWAPIYLDEAATLRLPPAVRLLIVLRCRSYRGRKELVLDAGIAAEAGIHPRLRYRYARMLEKSGSLRVESEGRRTLTVRVL